MAHNTKMNKYDVLNIDELYYNVQSRRLWPLTQTFLLHEQKNCLNLFEFFILQFMDVRNNHRSSFYSELVSSFFSISNPFNLKNM